MAVPVVRDQTLMLELLAKHAGKRPPVDEMLETMRASGYSEERIAKYSKWWQKMEETSEQRQKDLDAIFAKYPSASKGARVSKPKKIIRAVKKKIATEEEDA